MLIGSNILKVVATDSTGPTGSPDLLQPFGTSRKTGTLVVTSRGR